MLRCTAPIQKHIRIMNVREDSLKSIAIRGGYNVTPKNVAHTPPQSSVATPMMISNWVKCLPRIAAARR